MWQNPMCAISSAGGDLSCIDEKKFQEGIYIDSKILTIPKFTSFFILNSVDFDDFYDEIFQEFTTYGKIGMFLHDAVTNCEIIFQLNTFWI